MENVKNEVAIATEKKFNTLVTGATVEVRDYKARPTSKRAAAIATMNANAHLPASEVLPLIAVAAGITEGAAKGYYRYLSREGFAAGDGSSGTVKKTKQPKEPKAAAAPAAKAEKAPSQSLKALKEASKARAGKKEPKEEAAAA